MGSLSNQWENKVLDHVLGNTALTVPDKLFIALCTADPAEGGTGLAAGEVSGGEYVRQSCSTWNAATARHTQNTNEILFTKASGANWGTITHFAIMTTVSNQASPYMVGYGAFTTNKNVQDGDQGHIAVGELDITFTSIATGGFSNNLANKLLDHIFLTTPFSQPAAYHVGFSLATPGNNLSGLDEPTGGHYARVSYATWDAATLGASANTDAITFNEATATWGTITHTIVWDDASSTASANYLLWGKLTMPRLVTSGDTPRFSAGDLDITLG